MKKSYDEFQRKCDFRTIAAFCALLAAIVFAPSYASAQNFTLQGSVKTEKGEPVCVCKDGPVFEGSVFYG